ncbi:MAG: tRNA (N(6)-L-threonylcarbamoyladenosine(37)-C(2))-methylthiotransferase [Candidatus Micrarchaeota archaeon]|nr:tRNA (N(6)-L-threonylcarbamoyladenosine(37)-C(2))-methylthiotransferase [Candidatus Micrarchaeota archaeon]
MRVSIKTYGCTLNRADSDIIGSVIRDAGNSLSGPADSDVVLVNTCTVKSATSQKILYYLSNLERQGKRVVVSGCMAGANRDLIERYAPSASIVTNQNISRINEAVEAAMGGNRVVLDASSREERLALLSPIGGAVARIPVSDGCLSSCGFCETRFARGPLHSFKEETILRAIEQSARAGAREIQLTSQDMGAYGLDRKTNVAELMERIMLIDGDFRVRVGMLNPEHLHRYLDRLIGAMQGGRFYRFLHLPVQSGSDRVLREMGRKHTTAQFESMVAEIRAKLPGITIETDMIVGYPTETDADFRESLEMLKRVRPEVTNVSRFGARPHASASRLAQHNHDVVNGRSTVMARTVRSIQHEINDPYVGRTFSALMTEETPRSLNGRTDSYKQVVIPVSERLRIGDIANVKISSASANALYGSVAQ